MIVAVSPIKGGVGKSTLSVHLAAWLAEQGVKTLLVDCDPQQSSSRWIAAVRPDVAVAQLTEADTIFDQLPRLARKAEVVIADGPGNNSEISRALLSWADLALLPTKAGQLELDSLDQTIRVLKQVQALRKGPPEAMVVLTQVQDRFLLTQSMRAHVSSFGVSVAKGILAFRQVYADAPGQGKVVWQMEEEDPRAAVAAGREMRAVFTELLPKIRRKHAPARAARSAIPARSSR